MPGYPVMHFYWPTYGKLASLKTVYLAQFASLYYKKTSYDKIIIISQTFLKKTLKKKMIVVNNTSNKIALKKVSGSND